MVLAAVRRGAFFGALSDRLAENREYTRKTSDAMQEYLWTAGLNRRNEVKKSKVQLQEAFDYLTGNGLDEEKALGLLDTDPKEMLSLYKVAQNYKLKSGRLSSNILNSAVKMAEGYEAPDMTASELIKKAAPDFIEGADLDPPEQERSFLGKLFGTPSMDEIRYDVYSSEIMGRKGSDIMASISEPTIRARDAAGGVDTDYTGLGALDPTEMGRLETRLEDQYKKNVQTKIDELIVLEGKAQENEDGYSNADLNGIIARKEKLLDIQDLETDNEQMRAAMQNTDIGFGLAQEYYRQYPQMFIDRPIFINNDLLPFISGENTTTTEPEQQQDPESPESPESPEGPEDPILDFFIKEIGENQNPMMAAKKFFNENPPRPEFMTDKIVGIKAPDGTIKYYKFVTKRGLGAPAIVVEEVPLSEITSEEE
tara:strand:+ start:1561 stop:2835 length:1275 start_codon:yes stop_codon:yes gene_type:complete